jgi:hypothetical protein
MQQIRLRKSNLVALVDDEDYPFIRMFNWFPHHGYAIRKDLSKMEHLIMGPGLWDHRDLNPLNNQRHNLRAATEIQNNQNRRLHSRNSSGYKGVSWQQSRSKWKASIMANNQAIYLGLFNSPEDAAKAYDKAALEYHQEFALTNKMLGKLP